METAEIVISLILIMTGTVGLLLYYTIWLMKKSKKMTENSSSDVDVKDSYVCSHCGYVLAKKDAVISGWDSEHSLRHVHCPRCGKIITHAHRRSSKEKGV